MLESVTTGGCKYQDYISEEEKGTKNSLSNGQDSEVDG